VPAGTAPLPAWDDYLRCVHCGLCLNNCPTYRLWGMEADSPRGRIRQMLLVNQGELPMSDSFVTHIDRCLDCRACETVCPSGVEYGRLVEASRAQIERNYSRSPLPWMARNLIYRHLLPYRHRIALVAGLLRFYQVTRLQSLVRASGVLKLLGLAKRERLLPRIESPFFYSRLGKTFPAQGPRRARVALFAGCIAQVTFARLNEATIRVLTANGCEVVVPPGQVCCGALAAHAGVRDIAEELAEKNMNVFLGGEFDAIITNAAGCGSTLKEYAHLFPADGHGETTSPEAPSAEGRISKLEIRNSGQVETGDPNFEFRVSSFAFHERARSFSSKVRDVTEFLADLGVVAPLHETRLRVTYQDSCHLAHGQRIREAPRKLIRAVPGVEFVEMAHADQCCGSAGVYNVTQTDAALALLEEKMRHAKDTRAQAIVTANPGCILQLRAGADLHPTGQEVLHVVELLDRAIL
jgi:glycolate oxidase iron-sulfur subunit